MWYVCDVLYAVLYLRVSYFVVRGCIVSMWYIHVCNCDMFSVVNVNIDHLKLCCSECNIISNKYNKPTPFLVQHIGTHGGEVIYFGCFCFRGVLSFLNCHDICMCVVNMFNLLEFVFDSVYVDLQYDEIYITFHAGSVSMRGVCIHVVVFGLSVRLSWLLLFALRLDSS